MTLESPEDSVPRRTGERETEWQPRAQCGTQWEASPSPAQPGVRGHGGPQAREGLVSGQERVGAPS